MQPRPGKAAWRRHLPFQGRGCHPPSRCTHSQHLWTNPFLRRGAGVSQPRIEDAPASRADGTCPILDQLDHFRSSATEAPCIRPGLSFPGAEQRGQSRRGPARKQGNGLRSCLCLLTHHPSILSPRARPAGHHCRAQRNRLAGGETEADQGRGSRSAASGHTEDVGRPLLLARGVPTAYCSVVFCAAMCTLWFHAQPSTETDR